MRTVRAAATVGAASALLALLAGCTSNPVAEPPRTVAPATSTPTVPDTPTPPPTQDAADATPVSVRCKRLVKKDVAAALVPDLRAVPGWAAEEGSPAGRLEALKGTTCQWTDDAGDVLEVAVAKPSVQDSTVLKNDLVERSQSVPTYGGEAYFQVVDHVGQADVFRGRTWLFVRSNRFFEPGDATAVVDSALAALGYGRAPTASTTPTLPAPAPTDTAVG